MNPEFFISPTKPGKIIWGIGPALVIPTATDTILGQGKLSLGPGFVALTQPHHWTLGVLTNNVWSVAGSGSRPSVNQFLLQYFINYNMKKVGTSTLRQSSPPTGKQAVETSGRCRSGVASED